MAHTITRPATNGDRVAGLERQVAELRRELTALRDSLAVEVRTRRVVVADDDRHVEITPGWVSVSDERNGCHVVLSAFPDHAEIVVSAGDVTPPRISGIDELVTVTAWADWECVPGGPRAEIAVNGVELPVPAG